MPRLVRVIGDSLLISNATHKLNENDKQKIMSGIATSDYAIETGHYQKQGYNNKNECRGLIALAADRIRNLSKPSVRTLNLREALEDLHSQRRCSIV